MKRETKGKNILYTGLGDNGTTTLFHCDQGRISKSANVIEALGSLDELNAYLGIVKIQAENDKLKLKLKNKNISVEKLIDDIQQKLFVVQAEVAGSDIFLKSKDVKDLEFIISTIGKVIPPIKSFTISGGSMLSALFDFSRTLARRAERSLVKVQDERFKSLKPDTISYMNRLSSVLFAMSRYTNFYLSIKEAHPKY